MEQYMWIIWLALFVIMVIIEASGPALVSIWFAAGALISMIISFIPRVPWWVEVIVFVATSFIFFFALRPVIKKKMKREEIKSNVDSLVGKKGLVLSDITALRPGECKINDIVWTAIPVKEDEEILNGSVVEVVSINGNKLIVKKVRD